MSLTEGGIEQPPASDVEDKDAWSVAKYVAEIALYDREARTWMERRKKILKRYKDERSPRENAEVRFNILWSMTQTLKPALLARTPKPDIQRRFKDDDAVGRVTSDILERAVTYFVQEDDFMLAMQQCVDDYLLPGRATAWVRYVPHLTPNPKPPESEEDFEVDDDEGDEDETDLGIEYEEVDVDFVHVEDFGHVVCRTWEECWLVWRKVYLTREELVRRFGTEKGNLPPLDWKNRNEKDQPLAGEANTGKSIIYELWDKKRGYACWIHKELDEALDVRRDPLKLDGFFPCPRPLYATVANDSLIPVPDFIQWQDQAVELDSLTARMAAIQKALKVAGVYDASAQGISRLLAEGTENQLIPVESWAMFAEKGGIKGAIDFFPLEDIASALVDIVQIREQIKNDLYEITGIADIIRGQSDPNETMGAQQIKSNFATMRLSDRQAAVQRFIRDTIRIMVDVIANHFQIETIKEISGVRLFANQAEKAQVQGVVQGGPGPAPSPMQPQTPVIPPGGSQGVPAPAPSLPPPYNNLSPDQIERMLDDPTWDEVEQLIRNRALRCFRIDIETDSTIKADEEADKAQRLEFLQAASGFLQQAFAAGQQVPEAAPLLMGLLKFGIKAFPVGKELEGMFDGTMQKLEQMAKNPQQKPDPEMAKVNAQMQLEKYKADLDTQLAREKAQDAAKVAQAEQDAQAKQAAQENFLEDQRKRQEFQDNLALEQAKLKLAEEEAHIRAAAQVETARITAGLSDGGAFVAREINAEIKESLVNMGAAVKQLADAQAATNQAHGQAIQALAGHVQNLVNKPQTPVPDHTQHLAALTNAVADLHRAHQATNAQHQRNHGELLHAMTAEKELVRDKDGKAQGVRVKANGRAMH